MTYVLKFWTEVGWFVFVAVMTVLLQALMEFDPSKVQDWHVWTVSLVAASVRAGAAACLVALGKGRIEG